MDIRYSEDRIAKDDLVHSEFYNDWLRPQDDVGSGGGGVLFNDNGRLLILSGQVRFKDEESKTSRLIETLRMLAPHVRRAFDMQRALQGHYLQEEGYKQALDRVGKSVFLLDSCGTVTFANRQARKLLNKGTRCFGARMAGLVSGIEWPLAILKRR